MAEETRSGSGRAFRWGASLLTLLTLCGVVGPQRGWAQTAPARFDVSPSRIEQGECYTIRVGTPNITLDVKYRFNNGSAIILYGWPSIGSGGSARICTSSQTAPGAYTFVEARNTLGGAWVSGGDTLTVTAPPPPDFTITASPSSRSVSPTGSAAYTVSVSPRNGFNSTVNLSVSGLRSNVTARFSRSSLSSPYTSTSTLTLRTNGASAGTRSVTITGAGGGLSRTDSVNLTVLPQPTTLSVNPSSVRPPGSYTMTVGNGAGMTLDVQYTLTPPGGTPGPVQTLYGWPVLGAVAGGDTGTADISAGIETPPGVYRFTAMRNTLNTAWVNVNAAVTIEVVPQPDFRITAVPASVTVESGASATEATYTVSVMPLYGFNQAVTLSASGMPANVTVAFNPAVLSSPYGTSALRLTVPALAPAGTSAVTVTGTGGALSRTDSVDLTVVPQPTTYQISPTEGYAGAHSVTVTVGNGANMSLNLSYTLNGDPRTGTIHLDANGQWSAAIARDAETGTFVYTGMKNALASTWVTINAAYTAYSPQPTTLNVEPIEVAVFESYTMTVGNGAGMTLDVQYTLTPPGGTEGPETTLLNWPDLPAIPGHPNDGASRVRVPGCTLPGTYSFKAMRNTLNGREEDWVELMPVPVTVIVPALAVSGMMPPSIPLNAETTVDMGGTSLCGPLTLLTEYPGVTISNVVSDGTYGDGRLARADFTVTRSALPGVARITVTGREGTASFDLYIGRVPPAADFTITAMPASVTVESGASATEATYMVSVTPLNGFNQAVTLSASGLPTGGTAGFAPASLSAPYTASSTLTVTVPAGASAGTWTLTVTGTGGGLAHMVSVSLTVTVVVPPPADFTITAAPGARTVAPGESAAYTVTVEALSGFNQAVTLSASGLLTGGTAGFAPASLSAPYTASSTLTVTVPAGAPEETAVVTVTGTAGALSHTVSVSLTVTTSPPLQREYIYLGGRVIAVESP